MIKPVGKMFFNFQKPEIETLRSKTVGGSDTVNNQAGALSAKPVAEPAGNALTRIQPVPEIDKDFIQSNIEKLKQLFGDHKKVPLDILSNFYTAIGFYSELKDVNIKVRYGNIKTTMQCRPRWDFIFHKKENRSYVIYVGNKIKGDHGILYEHLPLNAQIGVIGHELAHIVDYRGMNNFQLGRFGFDYLRSKRKREIENRIDLIAIHRGLGYQIKDFSKYVFEDSGASFKYLRYKMKFYFRPQQINEILASSPIYCLAS